MRLWHTHDWIEHARTYAPPRQPIVDGFTISVSGMPAGMVERLLSGATSFIFTCRVTGCQAMKTVVTLGKDTR